MGFVFVCSVFIENLLFDFFMEDIVLKTHESYFWDSYSIITEFIYKIPTLCSFDWLDAHKKLIRSSPG